MTVVYDWRDGAPFRRLAADSVAKEFDEIRRKHGALDAQAVVDYARTHKRSELYKAFDWDVDAASNRWWVHQAQDLIGAIREVRVEGGETRVVRSNYAIGGGVFVSRAEVRESTDYQDVVLRRALSALEGWRERYSEIANLCGASDPVEQAIDLFRAALSKKDAAE
jgi:hypothetical protein